MEKLLDVDTPQTITHLSLCSGYEGIGTGLRTVLPNLREIAMVERETYVIANLVAKMEEGLLDKAPIYTDVKTFPYKKLRGCVDIMSFGFPCQPFSAAGKRNSTSDERHIFPYIAEGIKQCKPRFVFGENVAGIISAKTADGESVLKYVLRTMEQLGYRTEAGIFSAEECGAPHQRKRVFILGMAHSSDFGRRGRSNRNNNDEVGSSKQEAQEQTNLRGKVKGRGRNLRAELGDSSSNRCYEGGDDTKSRGTKKSSVSEPYEVAGQTTGRVSKPKRGCNATTELAHTDKERLQGELQARESSEKGREEQDGCSASSGRVRQDNCYPSRPSQPQYDWEAPRVKPRLGRATNGHTSRVDRLRLLGNGVVPATAAIAFKVLLKRLHST